MLICHSLKLFHIPVIDINPVVWTNSTLGNGEVAIWNNELRIDLQARTNTSTNRASTVGRVKRKSTWLKLRDGNFRVVRTRVLQAICFSFLFAVFGVGIQNNDFTFGNFERLLNALH